MRMESGATVTGIAKFIAAAFCAASISAAAEPAAVHRYLPDVKTEGDYKAVFTLRDGLKRAARYGELTVAPGKKARVAEQPDEEQVFVVLEGKGTLVHGGNKQVVRAEDFMYVPPGKPSQFACERGAQCRVIVAGYHVDKSGTPGPFQIANIQDVKQQTVEGHPPSTLYQLLMGDMTSKRDKLAAAQVVTSLFIMEFAPGGTNIPHHHENEEEIYLVLNGHGDIVAGSERVPAKAGDAFYFPPNCKVGFYSGNKEGEPKARILAIRSKTD